MKIAVVYYTLDGSSALVASEIASQINTDSVRLHTLDAKKRGFWGKMFWGCGMVMKHKKPMLKPYSFNASAYELIILGAPVWAGAPAPPIETFLAEASLKGKKIALFLCHGGGGSGAMKKFKSLLDGNEIVGEADFANFARDKNGALKKKLEDWVKGLKG